MAGKHARAPAVIIAPWGPEDVRRLTEMWAKGLSAQAIGVAMGRTKNSVIGAAHRNHLPSRGSPIKLGGVQPKVRVHRSKESEALRLAKKAEDDTRAARAVVVAAKHHAAAEVLNAALRLERIAAENLWRAPEISTAAIRRTGIGGRGCMYPLWGMVPPTHKYCGAAQRTGHVYCETHVKLCTTPHTGKFLWPVRATVAI